MAGDISSQLPIGPQRSAMPAKPTPVGPPKTDAAGQSFKDMLVSSLDEVNRLQAEANTAMQGFTTGKTQNVTEVLNAAKKAELAFDTLVQIRNKLVEAYEVVRDMRI